MSRPRKWRCVDSLPLVCSFGPRLKASDPAETGEGPGSDSIHSPDLGPGQSLSPDLAGSGRRIVLTVDELEAVRLKDLNGLDQAACAESMSVSRGTFQRILASARAKIAEALTEGLWLDISGGEYCLAKWQAVCPDCGCASDPARAVVHGAPCGVPAGSGQRCPHCGGENVTWTSCRRTGGHCSDLGCRRRRQS
ncbi:MAG: DUF134 domain-containing protein [Clostridia bacterium]|nr:DUF134 domain-containing protein [Clostridia bacterium]